MDNQPIPGRTATGMIMDDFSLSCRKETKSAAALRRNRSYSTLSTIDPAFCGKLALDLAKGSCIKSLKFSMWTAVILSVARNILVITASALQSFRQPATASPNNGTNNKQELSSEVDFARWLISWTYTGFGSSTFADPILCVLGIRAVKKLRGQWLISTTLANSQLGNSMIWNASDHLESFVLFHMAHTVLGMVSVCTLNGIVWAYFPGFLSYFWWTVVHGWWHSVAMNTAGGEYLIISWPYALLTICGFLNAVHCQRKISRLRKTVLLEMFPDYGEKMWKILSRGTLGALWDRMELRLLGLTLLVVRAGVRIVLALRRKEVFCVNE
ncbi:uncharacterized protein LOC129581287 [Paramacrobiotus metropolitanus]|uniref:uncharacterized protein LOC129581287 n=1 Tax=Paramacrobiotus metropolitanus TaxID=2943436 RepID=UPI0024460D5F|nr:uncharacterized protein LOC129581287 [Paramacrobiotus metropolitanus]XP_055328248.1 uncharacterized protein LOC129581287 [Paramacrobiotus metropolitanus]